MKRIPSFARSFRVLVRTIGLASSLVIAAGCGNNPEILIGPGTSFSSNAGTGVASHQLSNEGVQTLHATLEANKLAELNWPGFQRYKTEAKEFYAAFYDVLPWLQDSEPTPQALAMIEALKHADAKGLRPEDYDGPLWDGRVHSLHLEKSAPEGELIRFDVALTISTMRYILDLHLGRVNPHLFHFGLDVDHRNFDLSEFLRLELVNAKDVTTVLNSIEPPFPGYHRTIDVLNRYLALVARDDGQLLRIPLKVMKPGDAYPEVALLESRLQLLGDLAPQTASSSLQPVYQGSVVAAVKHFQARHGLDPSGRIDAQTLKQLNTPFKRRVVQLQLTLERWRWMPHQFARPPIVVNIPEFRLHVVNEAYQSSLLMKVVVGRTFQHRTPVFANQIKSVIFRPYWNVPLSIQRAEILPHLAKDSSYLTKNSYEVVDQRGNVVSDGNATETTMGYLQSGKWSVRQKPGPENALGLVKFEFPNPYDVYMHGTPAQHLFARSRRDFSHGCIRVEDPAALAAWVLRDQPEWTTERIREAMDGDETLEVNLKNPIPVLILYGTAIVLENGEVQFFDDIYGYDADLERTLSAGRSDTN
jgi:L,D-transpeptidase YcbB